MEPKKRNDNGRGANGRFVPGNKAGTGRPKKPPELKNLADKSLDEIKCLIFDKNTPLKIRADLCKWVYEQAYGKAQQKIDMDAKTQQEIVVTLEGELDDYAI